jgi:hypothetical protein
VRGELDGPIEERQPGLASESAVKGALLDKAGYFRIAASAETPAVAAI